MAPENSEVVGTQSKKAIHADATKDFFVTMITRDISLRDCIFDLLDNSIDGARRMEPPGGVPSFANYKVQLDFDADSFRIVDNCGGILLSDAIDYAFHFGRRPGGPSEVKGGIGLYGIGMKRAVFKIGRRSVVTSHASDASFKVLIDVGEWERAADWDFEYEDIDPDAEKGTQIKIDNLNPGAKELLGDPSFRNELVRAIARDYAFFIQKGLKIFVGADQVPSYKYKLRTSEQVTPSVESYEDAGVRVRILAGIVDDLPDDIPDELKPEKVDRFGWFVICNDRVVLAADKSEKTIWGADGFNVWHPQYNGFAGFVFFEAEDQTLLPWTTTKRELDASNPMFRRTVARMKSVTEVFIDYTNRRKADLESAREAEVFQQQVEVSELRRPQAIRLPSFAPTVSRPNLVTISYKRHKREVDELKLHFGSVGMSAKDVGIKTFEYYRAVELGK